MSCCLAAAFVQAEYEAASLTGLAIHLKIVATFARRGYISIDLLVALPHHTFRFLQLRLWLCLFLPCLIGIL